MSDTWAAVASLTDPSRRALYDYVRRQDHPVAREEAAQATGMSRGLAAFHLDKLVGAGLLAARHEAPPGRPRGRGRTPKVYEPAGDGLAVTVPERHYELIADILAEAVEAAAEPAGVAGRRGQDLGATLRPTGDLPGDLPRVLAGLGFEPRDEGGTVLLGNCPFHALAVRHTDLVCGINHAFVGGLLRGLGATGVDAHLVPRPGACCVQLRRH